MSNKTSKKTTNEKTTNNQLTKFEKVNAIIANVSILILLVFAFWILGSSNNWFSKEEQTINESIKSSERMHKEYLDTINASTSNIVEAIKSMKK